MWWNRVKCCNLDACVICMLVFLDLVFFSWSNVNDFSLLAFLFLQVCLILLDVIFFKFLTLVDNLSNCIFHAWFLKRFFVLVKVHKITLSTSGLKFGNWGWCFINIVSKFLHVLAFFDQTHHHISFTANPFFCCFFFWLDLRSVHLCF